MIIDFGRTTAERALWDYNDPSRAREIDFALLKQEELARETLLTKLNEKQQQGWATTKGSFDGLK